MQTERMWVKKSCGYAGHYSNPKSRGGFNSIPELELQLNYNSISGIGIELKTGIEFLQLMMQVLLVNQPLPYLNFNSWGHNLLYDWFVMQEVSLKFL